MTKSSIVDAIDSQTTPYQARPSQSNRPAIPQQLARFAACATVLLADRRSATD
jgi:hypothetical protein